MPLSLKCFYTCCTVPQTTSLQWTTGLQIFRDYLKSSGVLRQKILIYIPTKKNVTLPMSLKKIPQTKLRRDCKQVRMKILTKIRCVLQPFVRSSCYLQKDVLGDLEAVMVWGIGC